MLSHTTQLPVEMKLETRTCSDILIRNQLCSNTLRLKLSGVNLTSKRLILFPFGDSTYERAYRTALTVLVNVATPRR